MDTVLRIWLEMYGNGAETSIDHIPNLVIKLKRERHQVLSFFVVLEELAGRISIPTFFCVPIAVRVIQIYEARLTALDCLVFLVNL